MKKTLFLPLFLLPLFLSAQVRTGHVHVNPVEINGLTTYLFSVQHTDYEAFRNKLITEWGKPDKNTVGNMTWKMKSIKGVGDKLTIILWEGIFTTTEKGGKFLAFKSLSKKKKMISSLQKGQSVYLSLQLKDKAGTTISPEEAIQFQMLLENLISK